MNIGGSTKYVTLHNCDICGSLHEENKKTLYPNANFVTFYNDRLSCNIDRTFAKFVNKNTNVSYLTAIHVHITLLGNLFEVDYHNPTHIELLNNSSFVSATLTNLYLTPTDSFVNIGYLVIAAILFVCMVGIKITRCINGLIIWKEKKNKDYNNRTIVGSFVSDSGTNNCSNYNYNHNYNTGCGQLEFLEIIENIFNIISHWIVIIIVRL